MSVKIGKNIIQANPVTIMHSIDVAGYNLKEGMKMEITKIYFRNGETQLEGYVDGRKTKEEVPDVWTNIDYIS